MKTRRSLFSSFLKFVGLFAILGRLHAAAPTWDWVKNVPGDGASVGVAADSLGNVYWAGSVAGGNIGGVTVSQQSIFLARLSSAGTFQWSKTLGEGNVDAQLTLDASQNPVLSGFSLGPSFFGATVTSGLYVIAKFTTAGTVTWARNAGNWSTPLPTRVGGADDILFAGPFSGSTTIGTTQISSVGNNDVFVARVNAGGTVSWVKRAGGPQYDYLLGITGDSNGNAYATGITEGGSFGAFTVAEGNGDRGFIVKYSADGTVLWVQTVTSVQGVTASINGVTVLPDQTIAIVGTVIGPCVIAGRNVSAAANLPSLFYARLDPATGNASAAAIIMSQAFDGSGYYQRLPIASDSSGNVRFAGLFTFPTTFGTTAITNRGNTDIFAAAVTAAGQPLWIKTAGLSFADVATGISYDGAGHTYVSGYFQSSAVFDNQLIEGSGYQTFLAKINEGTIATPTFNSTLTGQTAATGQNVTFTANASSVTPLRYQWFFNSAPISNETNATLTLNAVNAADAGSYFVEVSNADGTVRSAVAELVIRGDAAIRVTTIAGRPTIGYVDSTDGSLARFYYPDSPAITSDGYILVPDYFNNLIRIVEPTGIVGTYAGKTNAGFVNGPASIAEFNVPIAIAIDRAGDVYVADSLNNMVRKINDFGSHNVTTYAGNGTAGLVNGPAAQAQFNFPNDLVFDSLGNLFVIEFNNHTVRKITPSGDVTTFAGTGQPGFRDGAGASAQFNKPAGIAVDKSNNLFITEWDGQRIRKITPSGIVSTICGTNEAGFVDGQGSAARLHTPNGIAADPYGNLYFTEFSNNSIRKVDPDGIVTTLAGLGTPGFLDGDRATALLLQPGGIAWYPDGSLIIADTGNNAIRKLEFLTNSLPAVPALVVNLHPGLTVFGPVGKTYRIEAAESTSTPLAWVSVGTLTLTHPVEIWFDTQPATRHERYYRATEVK